MMLCSVGRPLGADDDIDACAVAATPPVDCAGTRTLAEVPVSTPAGGVRVGSVLELDGATATDVVTGLKAVRAGTAGAVITGAGIGVVLTPPPPHAATIIDKRTAPIAVELLRTFTD
jgi:hypothetical protein